MERTGSVHFPFETDLRNNSMLRASSVEDTIASSIKAFLLTNPGSRRGNTIGCFLPSLLHKLIPSDQISKFEDELKQDLINQFPGISFEKVTLTPNFSQPSGNYIVSSLNVAITFSTPVTDLTDLTLVIT